MEMHTLQSDAVLLVFAAAGLVATFAAIVRDTWIRRRSPGPGGFVARASATAGDEALDVGAA